MPGALCRRRRLKTLNKIELEDWKKVRKIVARRQI